MEFLKINPSQIKIEGDKIKIYAPAQSDFFCNNGAVGEDGITPDTLCNAPFYFREITGDFVMKVKVSHNFQDTYDSASIMVMLDGKNWAKACFEKTDFDSVPVHCLGAPGPAAVDRRDVPSRGFDSLEFL